MHRPWTRRGVTASLLASSLVAMAGFAIAGSHIVVASGAPFSCQPGFYQVSFGQLNLVNPVTGLYDPIGSAYADTYNAMGYDTLDNFLYAIDTSGHTGDLLRIASDGSVTDLGRPTGLPATGFFTGDFDTAGNLVVSSGGASPWYVINVAAMTASPYTVTGASPGNDMVLISGNFYLLNNRTLTSVDYATGVATAATVSGAVLPASGTYGTAWSDGSGDIYFDNNATGKVYQLSGYTTASPSATAVLTGQPSSSNDAASCESAPGTFATPTAADDSYTLPTGTPFTASAPGVLGNDTATRPTASLLSPPTDSTSFTLNADGSFTYTASPGFSGTDTFTYKAVDFFGRSTATATVTLHVTPVANPDSYTTPYQTTLDVAAPGVLGNDSGTTLTVTSHTAPAHGSLTLDGDGSLLYTPNSGYAGGDSFNYTVTDSSNQTSTATVALTVSLPGAPVAAADTYATTAGSTLSVAAGSGVLSNDTGTAIGVTSNSAPAHGTLSLSPQGAFTYTPDAGFSGHDSFTYTITDAFARTSTTTASITVAPVAAATSASALGDGPPLTLTLPTPTGTGPFTYLLVTTPPAADGTASLNSTTGVLTFTPAPGFLGTVPTFTYTVTDPSGTTSRPAAVNLTITTLARPAPTPAVVAPTPETGAANGVDLLLGGILAAIGFLLVAVGWRPRRSI
jgi:large repetitive protein